MPVPPVRKDAAGGGEAGGDDGEDVPGDSGEDDGGGLA
jgi:hypothetical protein